MKCIEVSLLGQVENTYVFSNGIYYNGLFFQPDKYGIVGIEKPIHTIETDKIIVRLDLLENEKYPFPQTIFSNLKCLVKSHKTCIFSVRSPQARKFSRFGESFC